MNTKLFLISSIFLFSSFCFAGEIHSLAKQGNLPAVKKLLAKYKNDKTKLKELLSSKNEYGNTPLHYAVNYGYTGMLVFFIEIGADINIKNEWGRTLLHRAIFKKNPTMTKILVDNGAKLNIKDNNGFTPYGLAVRKGYSEIAKFLESKRNQGTTSASKCASAIKK